MSAAQKEQIYVELRKYHLDEFPEVLSNPAMNDALSEYRTLEDEIISMLLGLVNGKSEYVNVTDDLQSFNSKVKQLPKGNETEINERKHFVDKAAQLEHILNLAQSGSFTVRPPRKTRESTREVVTKVTKK